MTRGSRIIVPRGIAGARVAATGYCVIWHILNFRHYLLENDVGGVGTLAYYGDFEQNRSVVVAARPKSGSPKHQ